MSVEVKVYQLAASMVQSTVGQLVEHLAAKLAVQMVV